MSTNTASNNRKATSDTDVTLTQKSPKNKPPAPKPRTKTSERSPKRKGKKKSVNTRIIPLGIVLIAFLGLAIYGAYSLITRPNEPGTKPSIISQVYDSTKVSISGVFEESETSCLAENYDNKTYKNGESYTSEKDCLTCTCENGEFDCIPAEECLSHDLPGCLYDGTEYPHESVFEAPDDCNTCTCLSGTIECTTFDCEDGEPVMPEEKNKEAN